MTQIQKAGAIILSPQEPRSIALLYRGKQKDWSFPKGHIEDGENIFEAMEREVKEETGLNVSVIEKLPNLSYKNSDESMVNLFMFLVQSSGNETKTENEDDQIHWVPINEVYDKLSYDNLKDYYKKISNIIINLNSKN